MKFKKIFLKKMRLLPYFIKFYKKSLILSKIYYKNYIIN